MTVEDYWEAEIAPPQQFRHPDHFDLDELFKDDRGYMTRKRIMADFDRCDECGDDVGACGCDL